MNEDHPPKATPAPESAAPHAPCPQCAGKAPGHQQYIYSIGRLDVRFPSVSLEREFQQRERQLLLERKTGWANSGERLAHVLTHNPHLARAVCFVHSVGNIPAYIVAATGSEVLKGLVEAARSAGQPDAWSIVIGKRGPMGMPTTCGGLLAPMMACDQIYTFTLKEFIDGLVQRVKLAGLPSTKKAEALPAVAEDIFRRIAGSAENLGAEDGHRALNYFLVQHPGLFLAAVERANKAVLDSIETRTTVGAMDTRIVTVVLTFIDHATGVPERLFCRIDVTDEWPFVAEIAHGGAAPLGLQPYIETSSHQSVPY
ncbi:MAG: hypothetical protein ABI680_04085 [Chthoniobacteraceae bacterium]